MNLINRNYNSTEECPRIGVEKHFSREEIIWICNRLKINVDKREKERFKIIKLCDNLDKLIEYYKSKDERTKVSGINFYLLCLLSFKRIRLDWDGINRLIFGLKQICYEDNPIIDIKLYNSINNYLTGTMGYCEAYVQNLFKFIFRLCLYYGYTFEEFVIKINDIHIDFGTKYFFTTFKKVLVIMGLCEGQLGKKWDFKKNMFLNRLSKEMAEAFDEYCKIIYEEKTYKTAKTSISHLKNFFAFLSATDCKCEKISELTNNDIIRYKNHLICEVNSKGNNNSNATINHRLEEIDKMWRYFISNNQYNLERSIVSQYDKLKENKVYKKKISMKTIQKVVSSIINYNNPKYWRERLVLIIMINTGRRIHEILSLKYDSLNDNRLFFHKTKKQSSIIVNLNTKTIEAVVKIKEYASKYECEIYSDIDGVCCRRLLPRVKGRSISLITDTTINKVFKEIQILNGIVDENGKALFTSHDNKRGFVKVCLEAGISIQQLSKTLDQRLNTLMPYDIFNEDVLKVLHNVENKGLLVGNSFNNDNILNIEGINSSTKSIIEGIIDINIIERHKVNYLFKNKSLNETFPMIVGSCTDIEKILRCGEMMCIECNELIGVDIKDVDTYAIKGYTHLGKMKRSKNKQEMANKFGDILEKIYVGKLNLSQEEFKRSTNSAKKKVKENEK